MVDLSIVISAFNIEKYIERCIESVTYSKKANFEIIVIDDGSKDNTFLNAKKYDLLDRRVKVVSKMNEGVNAAREYGMNISNGNYVWFIDGDDWVENQAVDKILTVIDRNVDLILIDSFMKFDNKYKKMNLNNSDLKSDTMLKDLLLGRCQGCIWNKIIRREFLLSNKINLDKNLQYGEDILFSFEIAIKKPKLIVINECLYNYYQRSGSTTKVISEKVLDVKKMTDKCYIKYKKYNLALDEEFEYFLYLHNFKFRLAQIYLIKSKYSKILFENWKFININIFNNKYFKKYEKFIFKIAVIVCKNYYIGKFIGNIIRKIEGNKYAN